MNANAMSVDQIRDLVMDAFERLTSAGQWDGDVALIAIDDEHQDAKFGIVRIEAGEVWLVTVQPAKFAIRDVSEES